jgi:hypothetical protein
MFNKEDFINFIRGDRGNRSTASTGTKGQQKESAMPEGLEGFGFDDETPVEPADAGKVAETSFARRLLEASGFGPAQYLATGEVILGGDPAAQHLPDRVYYWPKSAGRPYQTILFELTQSSADLLKQTLFRNLNGVLEDALSRLVQDTLKGFEIGGERRKADVKQGKQDETLCVVSIRDERSKEYDSAQLICFGTVAKGEGSLETFHIREEARFWEPQLAQDHLERLYDRHFKKLASEKWQDAFISGEERKFARKLMDVCQGATANESNIQQAVIDLLEQIALSYGLRKKPGAERRLEATDLPADHDIGIAEGGGPTRRMNPFRGMTLRDERNRLLGYIIYCLDSERDAETLRAHLSANNRFHNVLVVYPNGESTGLELWQGTKPLLGKLTKRGAKFEGEGQVVNLLSRFFVVSKALVSNPVQLAQELAYRARYLRGFALRELEKPKADRDKDLAALYHSFHDVFLKNEDADEAKQHDEFADSYAQTLTYGLLSARWISKDIIAARGERFTLDNATGLLERTSPFFKELFSQVISRSHDASRDWLLQDITDLLDRIDIDAVFSGVEDDGLLGHDPVMHFYEPFLAAYDAATKRQRGVYYTPQPVVSYIVRSVHELLQTEFGLADGLADTTTWGEMLKKHPGLKLPPLTDELGEKRTIDPDEMFVQILDPATGTATFPVEVIEVIYRHLQAKWANGALPLMPVLPGVKTVHCREFSEYWNLYVPVALLPRLHGYELMMAAYAIAHLKIGLKLAETGYRFASTERARIYLTNALEPAGEKQMKLIGFDALAREAAAVNEIKRYKRFTVVIGNPPYSSDSQNKSHFASELVSHYKKNLNERKINLDDDYIKFIAFSERVLRFSDASLLGIITNNTYLDGLTLRTMRRELTDTFRLLTLVDLHGSASKKERSNDGGPDANVFDIEQGVSIMLGVRLGGGAKSETKYIDLRGTREYKYQALRSCGVLKSVAVEPASPHYFFTPKDLSLSNEWMNWISIAEAMQNKSGFMSQRDDFVIDENKHVLEKRINSYFNSPLKGSALKSIFGIHDYRNFSVDRYRSEHEFDKAKIVSCLFRPFDNRYVYFAPTIVQQASFELMSQLLRPNVGLIFMRQVVQDAGGYTHFFVTRNPVDHRSMRSSRGYANVAPLFLYNDEGKSLFKADKCTNFSEKMQKILLNVQSYAESSDANEWNETNSFGVFYYIYAIFHSPIYRIRYADFLKTEFPRLPLTLNHNLFHALRCFGNELTSLHLMESPALENPMTKFIGGRFPVVEKPSWSEGTVWLGSKKASGFQGVSEAVWNFHVGGYQVCHKWLKDRKGRTLTDDDIAHYHKIVVAFSETIRLMAEIDEVINTHGGWPGAFASTEG